MFSTSESAGISDKYTAVRLVGGNDLDDEGKAFMSRYGVRGYPTLLAMTSDGAVLSREFERTTEGILASMTGATETEADFQLKLAASGSKTDAESLRTLAGLYMARAQYEQARDTYSKLAEKDVTVDDQIVMLEILGGLSDKDGRKGLLEKLVETRATHAKHIDWRMDLAMIDLETQITSREQWLDVMGKKKTILSDLLTSVDKPADQAVVRNELANVLAMTGDVETATGHWDWILENARDSAAGAEALMAKASSNFRSGRFDIEKLKAGRALLQEVIEKHPDHPAAAQATRTIPHVDRAIDELAKKAVEEAAAKKAAEEAAAKKAAEEAAAKDEKKDDDGEGK